MDHTYIAYLSKSFLPKHGLFHRYFHFSMLCEFQGQGHNLNKKRIHKFLSNSSSNYVKNAQI